MNNGEKQETDPNHLAVKRRPYVIGWVRRRMDPQINVERNYWIA